MSTPEVLNFMETPLAIWVHTFANPGDVVNYDGLVDGTFLHHVLTQIDPRAKTDQIILQCEDSKDRHHNWDIIMRNIRLYYEDVLQMYIVMKPPDLMTISREPHSLRSHEELTKVLLLLLGCAVQCENKETFIENIKSLHLDTQHAIVEYIQEITDDSRNIYPRESPPDGDTEPSVQSKTLHSHLKQLLIQRDSYIEEIRDLTQTTEILQTQLDLQSQKSSTGGGSLSAGGSLGGSSPANVEKHHLGVEVAELKGRVRRLRQELEEKNELCQELKDELDEQNQILTKLRNENLSLTQDARSARAYRDEIDVLNQKASRADKLEAENGKYKEKLNELDFYKARVEELRDDNMILVESKLMLEEQLASGSKRVEQVVELENEIQKYKQQLEDLAKSRDTDRESLQELADENARLEHEMKSSMKESANLEHDLRKAQKLDSSGLGDSLSDQLRETANARILRIELDNQRLSKELDELHDQTVLENSSRQLELEKENQRLAKKVTQLQESGSKEAEKVEWLEEQTITISRDKEQMRRTLETVRESNERQVQELSVENEQLLRSIETLRERAEKSEDLRHRDVMTENTRLEEAVRELTAKISRLDCDNRHLKTSQVRLTANVERLKDVEEEKSSIERQCGELTKTVTALQAATQGTDELERNVTDLEIENHKLVKTVENLQKSMHQLEELEQRNVTLNVDNQKLQRTLNSAKHSNSKLVDLESEKDTLNQEIQSLRKALDQEKQDRSKHEQTELDLLEVDTHNQKLQKQNQTLQRRVEELQFQNAELENENHKLTQNLESLKSSLKKLNEIERDNQELDLENQTLQRETGQYEKEVKRLRESLSGKESTIDDHTNRISELERELKSLHKSVEKNKEAASRLKETEKENKEILQQMTGDKRTLATLRQDLVNEKVRTQQLNNELEKVSQELEKLGLNREKLVAAEQTEGESRYKALESMMEQAYQKSLEIKAEKIHSLESRLEESMSRNQKVQTELKLMKRKYEGLRQQIDEDGNILNDEQNQNHLVRTPDTKAGRVSTEVTLKTARGNSTREILSIQERLVDVERTNATLLTENKIMKMQTEESRKRISTIENTNTNLHVQLSTVQQKYNTAQMDNAKLQVEASTLHSQTSTLNSQFASIKSQLSSLENENEQVVTAHDELQSAHETLVTDHEQLQHIHEQLSSEYESLISEHGSLKSLHKALKTEYKEMSTAYNEYVKEKESMGVLKLSIEQDRDKLRKEAMNLGSLQTDYINVKDENYRLNMTNQKLNSEYNSIYSEYKSMKNEYNNLQVKYSNLQGEFNECRDQLNTMDMEFTKMANKIESLNQLNCQLEEENRDLMLQLKALLSQNQELLTHALASKDHYHEEELAYVEKLSNLQRQKEKLEEKIMEQFRRYDPSPKKNRGIGARIARKAKGLITRNRERSRSRSETPISPETAPQTDSQDTSSLGSYTGAIDNANSPYNSKTNTKSPRQTRSMSLAAIFSPGKSLKKERKMSTPTVLDSRVRGTEGGGRLSRQGKFSSTTGLNLLSTGDEQAGFKLRGFKSTENLLTRFDSPKSDRKLNDADSGAQKTPGSDSAKDRLSQRSDSTDSSNTASQPSRSRLVPSSLLDRTPDPSPRDSGKMADYGEDVNRNSPRSLKPLDHVDSADLSRDSDRDKSHTSLTSSDSGPRDVRAGLLDGPRPYQSPHAKKDVDMYVSPRLAGSGQSLSVLQPNHSTQTSSTSGSIYSPSSGSYTAEPNANGYINVMTSGYTPQKGYADVTSAQPYSKPSGYSTPGGLRSNTSYGSVNSPSQPSVNSPSQPSVNSPSQPSVNSPSQPSVNGQSPSVNSTSRETTPNSGQMYTRPNVNTPVRSVNAQPNVNQGVNQGAPPIRNYRHDQQNSRPTSVIPNDVRTTATVTSQPSYPDPPPVRRRRRPQSEFVSEDAPGALSQASLPRSERRHGDVARVQPERPATVAAEPIRHTSAHSELSYSTDRRLSSGTLEYSTHKHYHTSVSSSTLPSTQSTGPSSQPSGQIGGYDVRRRSRQQQMATPGGDEGYNSSERRRRGEAPEQERRRTVDGSGIIMRGNGGPSGPPVPARTRRSGSNPNILQDDSVIPQRRQRPTSTLPARPKSVMATRDQPLVPRDQPFISRDQPLIPRDRPMIPRDQSMPSRDLPMTSRDAPMTSRDAPRLAAVKPYNATMMPPRPSNASTDLPATSDKPAGSVAGGSTNGTTKKQPVCSSQPPVGGASGQPPGGGASGGPRAPPRRRRAVTPSHI